MWSPRTHLSGFPTYRELALTLETSVTLLAQSSPLRWKIRMRIHAHHRKPQRRNIAIDSQVGRHFARLPDLLSVCRTAGHISAPDSHLLFFAVHWSLVFLAKSRQRCALGE